MRKNTKKRKNEKEKFSPWTVTVLGLLFVMVLGFLHVRVEYTRTGYEISQNRSLEKKLIKTNQTLKSHLLKLKSYESLEPTAKKMGFRLATYRDVIFVEEVILAGKGE